MKKTTILIVFYYLLIQSCVSDKPCDQDIYIFEGKSFFVLLDSNENDLIVDRQLFNPDSIRLDVDGLNAIRAYQFIGTRESTYFYLNNLSTELEPFNESIYFLHFNSQYMDTMRIVTERSVNDCGAAYSAIKTVVHNGDTLPVVNNNFAIYKNF